MAKTIDEGQCDFFSSSLQIKFISISFVLGLSGGDHSLQRLVSSRIASKLSIDTIYDSSARKYYEYIIKSVGRSFGVKFPCTFSIRSSYFYRKMIRRNNSQSPLNNFSLLITVISKHFH